MNEYLAVSSKGRPLSFDDSFYNEKPLFHHDASELIAGATAEHISHEYTAMANEITSNRVNK